MLWDCSLILMQTLGGTIRIALRLNGIRCNPSYNVKERLSVNTHLTKESMPLEEGPLIISKSLIKIWLPPSLRRPILTCHLNVDSQREKKGGKSKNQMGIHACNWGRAGSLKALSFIAVKLSGIKQQNLCERLREHCIVMHHHSV